MLLLLSMSEAVNVLSIEARAFDLELTRLSGVFGSISKLRRFFDVVALSESRPRFGGLREAIDDLNAKAERRGDSS